MAKAKAKTPTMTMAEFYARLAKTPRDWYLFIGAIRRRDDSVYQCPIVAVAEGSGTFDALRFAQKIGLSNNNAKRIMDAADFPDRNPTTRKKLLAACGL